LQKTISNPFVFSTADAQSRTEKAALRNQPQITQPMKKLGIPFLLALLGIATPLLLQAQPTQTYTFTTNRLIPDGDPSGLSDVRTFNSSIGNITSVTVHLNTTGEFNGDLYGYLVHSNGFSVLLNRPGKTASNPYGYADSGLNVTFQDGAANGDIHLYESKTIPAPGSPLTGTWQPDDRNVDPATVFDTSPRTTALANFNGLNAAGQWTLFLADMESGGTNELTEWSVTIAGQAYPTLTWANPADIIYGTALGASPLNATANYDSTNVSGTFSFSPGAGTVLNAGSGQTIAVTFTPADSTDLLPFTTNVTINVSPAPLTITAQPQTITYGTSVPSSTVTYSGFVNGNTSSSLTTQPTVSSTLSGMASAGTYTGNYTASGAVDPNYSFTYVSGALTVNKAALTITAQPQTITYGTSVPSSTVTYSGFVNGNTSSSLTTQPTVSSALSGVASAGTYTGNYTASGAVDPNYSFTYVSGTLMVNKAALTITANDATKVYGAPLPVFTVSYSGFVNSDAPSSLITQPAISTTQTASSPAGTYPETITASGSASPNYSFIYVAGTLTITQSASTALVTSSANPALPGASVTFTVTLGAVAPGAGTPSGTVNFRVNGSIGGSGTLSGGVATFATNALPHGSNTVVAEYAGELNFTGATNSLTPAQVIDTPPAAGNFAILRYPTEGVKVSLPNILTNCSDADGDPLTITVSPTSPNGATITVTNGWVFYTPPLGFTNTDSFTYTVTDPYGESAVGTVTVDIEVSNSQSQNLAITDLGNGSVLIIGNGIPGYTYHLQSTSTLSPPNWQDIGTVTANSTGAFQYTDDPVGGTIFYRTKYP
jgi:subtilisin-like proprotein convertase family protein